MMTAIHIHQIYYLPAQLPLLDEAFIPYDNTANEKRDFAEYHIFEKEYRAGKIKDQSLTGYVSWKFAEKTKLTGQIFTDFIQGNPGYDVYFINPFPMQMKFFRNMWIQGEFFHPGILRLAQRIFDNAGRHVDLSAGRHDANVALYCNYWAGTRQFWEIYMEYIAPIIQVLQGGLSDEDMRLLHSIADHGNNFSFIAFIIERVFTTLLTQRPDIRYLAYRHTWADIRRKYGVAGAMIYKLFPDNSRFLNLFYTALKKAPRPADD